MEWASPFYWQGLLFRVWCSSPTRAQLLEALVKVEVEFNPLRKAWGNLGPNLDVKALELAIRQIAAGYNIQTWNDTELVAHLKKLEQDLSAKMKRVVARHA